MSQPTTILPVEMLAEGTECLVVGGGKVACRKAKHFLDAGALVTVVSPEVGEGLQVLIAQDLVTWEQRCFEASDLAQVFLAVAATDDPQVNQAVIDAGRDHRVPVNRVDKQWRDGDWITPAVIRRPGLTVSIATARTCEPAKLKALKEKLAEWLDKNAGDFQ